MSSIRCPLNETAHINQNEPACIDRNRVYFYPQLETAAEQVANVACLPGIVSYPVTAGGR